MYAVTEWIEAVAGAGAARSPTGGLGPGQLAGLDPVLLAGPYSPGCAVPGQHNRVGAGVGAHPPGEHGVGPLGVGGLPGCDHLPGGGVGLQPTGCLHQEFAS